MLKYNIVTILYLFNVSLFSMREKISLKRNEKEEIYNLYKNATEEQDRQNSIENIKQFYNEKKISWNDPYYPEFIQRIDGFKQKYGQFPIDCALRCNEVEFSLFLLKDIKVNVKNTSDYDNNTIHFFARGIVGNKINANHVEILKVLIEKKADINAINKKNMTPLAEYIYLSKNNIDNTILRLFFENNAQTKCNKNKDHKIEVASPVLKSETQKPISNYDCNLWSILSKSNHEINIKTLITFINEYLFNIKKNYIYCLFLLKHTKNKKLPKFVKYIICNKVIKDELYELNQSIHEINQNSSNSDDLNLNLNELSNVQKCMALLRIKRMKPSLEFQLLSDFKWDESLFKNINNLKNVQSNEPILEYIKNNLCITENIKNRILAKQLIITFNVLNRKLNKTTGEIPKPIYFMIINNVIKQNNFNSIT